MHAPPPSQGQVFSPCFHQVHGERLLHVHRVFAVPFLGFSNADLHPAQERGVLLHHLSTTQQRNLRGTSEEQQRNSRGTSEEQQRNSRGTSEEQQRNSRGTSEEQQRNSRGTAAPPAAPPCCSLAAVRVDDEYRR